MKKSYVSIILLFLFFTCDEKKEMSSLNSENWTKRNTTITAQDSLEYGKTYLSIYSQIYSLSEHKTHNLTAMASLRNTSDTDTIYILKAEYYDTHGNSIRHYLDHPIYLAPMETVDMIIDEVDITGGTGSNFIFEWNIPQNSSEPLFEGIMNSTVGKQGLSFITQGVRVK